MDQNTKERQTLGDVNGRWKLWFQASSILGTALCSVLLMLLTFGLHKMDEMAKEVTVISKDMAVIKSTRYTPVEHSAFADSVNNRFSEQRNLIAGGNGQATAAWNKVLDIEKALDRLRSRHEAALAAVWVEIRRTQ